MYFIKRNREVVCGGWEQLNEECSQEVLDIFYKATSEYTPIKLIGKQVVAGMNYKFEAKNANGETVIIVIYQDLEGNCSIR